MMLSKCCRRIHPEGLPTFSRQTPNRISSMLILGPFEGVGGCFSFTTSIALCRMAWYMDNHGVLIVFVATATCHSIPDGKAQDWLNLSNGTFRGTSWEMKKGALLPIVQDNRFHFDEPYYDRAQSRRTWHVES